jgi:hypothetical protein
MLIEKQFNGSCTESYSLQMLSLSLDGESIYVSTGASTIDRIVYEGQVIQLQLVHER